jgi:hypothetical protein
MARKMNLDKLLEFHKGLWRKLGQQAIDTIKIRTQKGIDREGYRFEPYSESYADRKASGFKDDLYGRPENLRGLSLDRQVTPPNFRLRGFTMGDLKIRAVATDAVTIGWQGEFAEIVNAHEQRGKYRVAGVTDKEFDKLIKIIDQQIDGNFRHKTRDVEVTVTVR